jgi:hypothetical protein
MEQMVQTALLVPQGQMALTELMALMERWPFTAMLLVET